MTMAACGCCGAQTDDTIRCHDKKVQCEKCSKEFTRTSIISQPPCRRGWACYHNMEEKQ